MNTILLFDPNAEGHHTDYLLFLVHYWNKNYSSNTRLVVVTEANLLEKYQHEYTNTPFEITNATFDIIPADTVQKIHSSKAIQRSFLEWDLVKFYQQKHQPTHILLMYFDTLQLGLLMDRKLSVPVSGIYFRPFHEPAQGGWKERLNNLKKKTLVSLLLRQHKLHHLFCLDSNFVTWGKKNAHYTQTQIAWLADPVERFEIQLSEIEALRNSLEIEPNRKIALLFGSLDSRKGIEQTLDAIEKLPDTVQKNLCLLLVGKIEESYQAVLVQKLAQHHSKAQVITVFKGVYGRDIQQYFELADFTLAPYQKHVGSSSVVIRSLLSRKPLLASDYGYLGNFITKHQIGLTVDSASPSDIAQGLQSIINQGFNTNPKIMDDIVEKNLAIHYATILLNGITE